MCSESRLISVEYQIIDVVNRISSGAWNMIPNFFIQRLVAHGLGVLDHLRFYNIYTKIKLMKLTDTN
jgi:hypothetical protein